MRLRATGDFPEVTQLVRGRAGADALSAWLQVRRSFNLEEPASQWMGPAPGDGADCTKQSVTGVAVVPAGFVKYVDRAQGPALSPPHSSMRTYIPELDLG